MLGLKWAYASRQVVGNHKGIQVGKRKLVRRTAVHSLLLLLFVNGMKHIHLDIKHYGSAQEKANLSTGDRIQLGIPLFYIWEFARGTQARGRKRAHHLEVGGTPREHCGSFACGGLDDFRPPLHPKSVNRI